MVHGHKTFFLVAPLKLRELRHPEEIKFIIVDHIQLAGHLDTQRSQNAVHDLKSVRRKKQQIPRLTLHSIHKCLQLLFGHEFRKRGFVAAVRLYRQICQSLRAVALSELHQRVNLLSRHLRLSLHIDTADAAASAQTEAGDSASAAAEEPSAEAEPASDAQTDGEPDAEPAGDTAEPEDADAPEEEEELSANDYRWGIVRNVTEAEPLPLVDSATTLTAWDYCVPPVFEVIHDYGTDGQVYRALQERTGVTLNFTTANLLTASTDMALMVAANELPDIIFDFGMFNSTNYDDLIDGDIIVNFCDYEDLMPNYFDIMKNNPGIARDAYTEQGNLCLAHNIQQDLQPSGGPVIRQDWLDADGLDTPATVDQLHEVLLAFQANNDCKYPMWVSSAGTCTLNIAYGVAVDNGSGSSLGGFIYQDDKVEYCVPMDGFRDYIQLLADWYAEGLISPDFMSQAYNNSATDDQIVGNACGFFTCSVNGITNLSGYEPESDVEPVRPMVLNEGDSIAFDDAGNTRISKGGAAIAGTCPEIELACRILDYFYSDEGILLANYGVEGVSFEYNADGEPELTELVTNSPEGYAFPVALIKYTSATPCSICINSRNYLGYTDAQMKATELWLRTSESVGIPGAVWETDAQNEYTTINTDLGSFVSTNCLQFITGAKPMSDWDAFIDQAFASFDIDRMVELYQEAVDTYMARGI